jgi:hypothetical protein
MPGQGSGCGRRPALWTGTGPTTAPRGQLAAFDPPPDEDDGAGEGEEEGVEVDEPSFDGDDEELSFDDDDGLSDTEAALRLSVR